MTTPSGSASGGKALCSALGLIRCSSAWQRDIAAVESVQAVLPVILGDLGFFVDDDGTVVSEEAMDQSDGQPVPGRRIVLADLVERVMSG